MIRQFSEDIDFKLKGVLAIKKWLKGTLENEGFTLGEINYIFCSDNYILKIIKDKDAHTEQIIKDKDAYTQQSIKQYQASISEIRQSKIWRITHLFSKKT